MKRPLCQRKTGDGLEKDLANLWSGKKITKKAHAGRGLETIWEMSVNVLETMIAQPDANHINSLQNELSRLYQAESYQINNFITGPLYNRHAFQGI